MPTIYTFTKKNAPGIYYEGASGGHYMNQPIDGARIAIQGIGNGPMTTDVSVSVVSSPAVISATLTTTLTTPESAVEITICPIAYPVNVSEVNTTLSSYFQIPANTPVTLDISNCAFLYLQGAGVTATTAFFYNLV